MTQKERSLESRATLAEAEIKRLEDQIRELKNTNPLDRANACVYNVKIENKVLYVQAVRLREALENSQDALCSKVENEQETQWHENAKALAQTESLASLSICSKEELDQLVGIRDSVIKLFALPNIKNRCGEWKDVDESLEALRNATKNGVKK